MPTADLLCEALDIILARLSVRYQPEKAAQQFLGGQPKAAAPEGASFKLLALLADGSKP